MFISHGGFLRLARVAPVVCFLGAAPPRHLACGPNTVDHTRDSARDAPPALAPMAVPPHPHVLPPPRPEAREAPGGRPRLPRYFDTAAASHACHCAAGRHLIISAARLQIGASSVSEISPGHRHPGKGSLSYPGHGLSQHDPCIAIAMLPCGTFGWPHMPHTTRMPRSLIASPRSAGSRLCTRAPRSRPTR